MAADHRRPKSGRPAKDSAKQSAPARPLTRAELRRLHQRRRARLAIGATLAVCVLILVSWFPASALISEHHAVNAASAQLDGLRAQTGALSAEGKRLSEPAEVERIAREKYQLVLPGQQAYTVLPPNDAGDGAGQYAGDPGFQKAVSPNASSDLPPGQSSVGVSSNSSSSGSSDGGAASGGSTGTSSAARSKGTVSGSAGSSTSGSSAGSSASGQGSGSEGLLSRIEQTLEFWR